MGFATTLCVNVEPKRKKFRLIVAIFLLFFISIEIVGITFLPAKTRSDEMEIKVTDLCKNLTATCEKNGFKGAVAELEAINGPIKDPKIESLIATINTSFGSLFRQLFGGGNLQEEAWNKIEVILKQDQWLTRKPSLKKDLPDYFLQANWNWVDERKTIQFVLRIIKLNPTAEFLEVSTIFNHPNYNEQLMQNRRRLTSFLVFIGFILLSLCAAMIWTPEQ